MSNMASDAKTCFSSEVEYRAVIRYLYLKGKTGKEIHGELADVYGSSNPLAMSKWQPEHQYAAPC